MHNVQYAPLVPRPGAQVALLEGSYWTVLAMEPPVQVNGDGQSFATAEADPGRQ